MKTIRPFEIFGRLGGDNNLQLVIPSQSSAVSRSVMMLETALLVAAARITNSRKILEIGTSLGYTALHLARNVEGSQITTVDIVDIPRVYEDRDQITQIIGPSDTITVQNYDMVFIDGDHGIESLVWDTNFSFQCSPSVVAWHDYGNASEPDVKPFLDSLKIPLYNVGDSWLVFWFKEGL